MHILLLAVLQCRHLFASELQIYTNTLLLSYNRTGRSGISILLDATLSIFLHMTNIKARKCDGIFFSTNIPVRNRIILCTRSSILYTQKIKHTVLRFGVKVAVVRYLNFSKIANKGFKMYFKLILNLFCPKIDKFIT